MKLVYIASPYAGDIPNNVERAKEYCKQALEQGVIPVAPHLLYPQFLKDSDPAERIRRGRTDEFVRPRWMLWENVPGAFSSGQPRGEDFRAVLEETARVVDPACHVPRPAKGKWLGSGYLLADSFSIAWRTVDAQFFGVPQRRRRIALIADFAGLCAPEILFVENGLQRYYPPGQSTAEAIAQSLAAST